MIIVITIIQSEECGNTHITHVGLITGHGSYSYLFSYHDHRLPVAVGEFTIAISATIGRFSMNDRHVEVDYGP